MRTLLVAEADGFPARAFVRDALSRENTRVVAVGGTGGGGGENRLAAAEGADPVPALLGELFLAHHPDAVVLFPPESAHLRMTPSGAEAMVRATLAWLEAAQRYVAGLGPAGRERFRLVRVSTAEVYGAGRAHRIVEGSPYSPDSLEAAAHGAADGFVRAYARSRALPALVAVPAEVYGPGQTPPARVPAWIEAALAGEPLRLHGGGHDACDWLYVGDLCRALWALLEGGRPGQTYHVSPMRALTHAEMADAICAILELECPAATNPALGARGIADYRALKHFAPERRLRPRRVALDAAKIQRELGWTPRVEVEEGLACTVRAWLDGTREEATGAGRSASGTAPAD